MPQSRSLSWRIYPAFVIITVLTVILVSWVASDVMKETQNRLLKKMLNDRMIMFSHFFEQFKFDPENRKIEYENVLEDIGNVTNMRITIISPLGTVLLDSSGYYPANESQLEYPEVQGAVTGKVSYSRRSTPNGHFILYAAMPVMKNAQLWYIIRAAISEENYGQSISHQKGRFVLWGSLIILIAGIFSLRMVNSLTNPIRKIMVGAEQYAAGNLTYRMDVTRIRELAMLADAMNLMASQLSERIKMVVRQRNELEAMLSRMVEAVIVVDTEEYILRYNKAAEELFKFKGRAMIGRTIHEAVRNIDLHRFIRQTLSFNHPVTDEITILNGHECYLQVSGTTILDDQNSVFAALIVLHDVTELQQLERVRRDFVANVSHELRTPITSIKGFVETLREGAMDDPENARRFLDIILRHSNHMTAVIEDLLSLSRIEQQSTKGTTQMLPENLNTIIDQAVIVCVPRAEDRNTRIQVVCKDDIRIRANSSLLEHAVINLVDNAVKYSNDGSEIIVEGDVFNNQPVIRVKDHGCGITPDELPRIFERFYRVNSPITNAKTGTGLGLAIVKHIAHAHGGHVDVESEPEKGSVFTVVLPETCLIRF